MNADIKDPPRSLWGILRSIGPGLILTANIVGTGELIATTKLGAEVGFVLLWFIVLGCLVKVFVQVELGRYTISEGVGSLQMLDRLPGPRPGMRWVLWLWVLMYLGTLCQMAGMVGGVAKLFASSGGVHYALAASVAVSSAAVLLLGRYGIVEKVSTVMVVAFTICNLLALAFLQGTPARVTGDDLATGLSFNLPADLSTAFVAFGITGVGAAELIFYPIWCLEKGYARAAGPRDGSPAWLERAQGWARVMRWDAWLSLVVYTAGTIAFYLLGAAVLNRQGQRVDDRDPIGTLSRLYTETFGSWGIYVFYIGAFMVLYSTYFVSLASNARLFADAGGILKAFRFPTPEARMRVVRFAIVGIGLYTFLLYVWQGEPVKLVLIGGAAQALMLPFLAFAALWFRGRVHPGLKAGRAWTVCLAVCFAVFACLGVFQLRAHYGKLRDSFTHAAPNPPPARP